MRTKTIVDYFWRAKQILKLPSCYRGFTETVCVDVLKQMGRSNQLNIIFNSKRTQKVADRRGKIIFVSDSTKTWWGGSPPKITTVHYKVSDEN